MRPRHAFAALLCLLAFAGSRVVAAPAADATPVQLAYKFNQGDTLRYKLNADIKGSLPLFDNPVPSPVHGVIALVYLATPKATLADGTTDIELKVESADVTLEDVPMPIPLETVEQILNQTITLDKTGKVVKVQGGDQPPLGLSIPGIDPKRLYVALFPIVFKAQAVAVGDTWPFSSELLGGQAATSSFTATVVSPTGPVPQDKPAGGKAAPARGSGFVAAGTAAAPAMEAGPNQTRLREVFALPVSQRLGADKKPVTGDQAAYRTRKGNIAGNGVYIFDRDRGIFTRGVVNISANIVDTLVGKPKTEDEPKVVKTTVNAVVTVQLQPASAGTAAKDGAQ